MRKKVLLTSFLAVSLMASLSLTSFAGWEQDNYGWYYVNNNGVRLGGGWFTDPDTKLVYYMDPGGYMMSDTMVEGYKLAVDGHRLDKTPEQLEAEAKKAQEKASKPTPNKVRLQIESAGKEAVSRGYSVWTLRTHYQSEMQAFMDKIFKSMADEIYKDRKERRDQAYKEAKEAAQAASLANEDGSSVGEMSVDLSKLYPTSTLATKDNEAVHYSIYRLEDKQDIIAASYSKISKKDTLRYLPYAFELSYNRGITSSESDLAAFDQGYKKLLIASLGQEQGNAVYEQVMAGTLADGATGNTDSGNTFEVINKDGIVKIRVTCSEQTAESESENTEAENTETEENSSEQTAAASEEKPATSPVITPGQSQESAEEQENTEDQQSAENQESTTEQQPEENQENTEG